MAEMNQPNRGGQGGGNYGNNRGGQGGGGNERGGRDGNRGGQGGGGRQGGFGQERERSEFVDKLVGVRRVAKTVKGGRRMQFGAVVVVGDEAGRVGWGKGKAKEVPDAVRKATDVARRGLVRVALRQGRTIHHEVQGSFGATNVIIRPAVPGTGIIAGGPMRAIFEAMGVKDVVAKALGSTNPYNIIQATFNAFSRIETPRGIAAKRGLKITDLVLHKEESSKGEVDQTELLEMAAKAKALRQKKAEAEDAKRAAQRPQSRGGRPGGQRDGGRDGGGQGGAPRGAAGGRRDEPKVVAVSKSDSMQQAVSAPAEAAAPAATETTES